MAKTSKNNPPREIRDIRFPTSHVPEKQAAGEIPARKLRAVPRPPRPARPVRAAKRRFPIKLITAFACIALVTAGFVGVLWYRQKAIQANNIQNILTGANLPTFDLTLPDSIGEWVAAVRGAFSELAGFGQSPLEAVAALSNVSLLSQEIPAKFAAKDGPGLIADFAELKENLALLENFLVKASSGGGSSIFSGFSGYAAYLPDLRRAQVAVDKILEILNSPGEHHVMIFFGNSAELRPGGGFLGSYAEISFGSSTIRDVVVRDINEVDRGLTANIVPPKPVQSIATRWRAADANWFFNYPDSAAKTLELMGRSSMYSSSTLHGAVLMSPKVIQDLLDLTGPIVLDDGETSVNSETIIPMIQSEVQAGQASGADNPKEILSRILPSLEAEFMDPNNLPAEDMIGLFLEWIQNKDLVFYMEDPELMRIASHYDAAGESYVLPESFRGDYFAAVNANLGGGKSDARIADVIDFESNLRADGVIENKVSVIRENSATSEDGWWYRVTNQNYLQIFTPRDVSLTAASGGRVRTINPRANYSSGFERDPDVVALESTFKPAPGFAAVSQSSGTDKNIFATWTNTPAGGSSTARFEYRRSLEVPFRHGSSYYFIFERQPGANQSLRLVLNAPPGFVWTENNLSKFEYLEENVPGRVILDLELIEIDNPKTIRKDPPTLF